MNILQLLLITIAAIHLFLHIKSNKRFKIIPKYILIGFFSNFLDFFGIGSYTQQTIFLKQEEDFKEKTYLIPGTLNVSNYVPIIIEALIIVTIIDVDYVTLISLPLAAFIGSFLGSKFISLKNNKIIMKILSLALIISAILLIMNAFNIYPFSNATTEIYGLKDYPLKLLVAIFIYLVLGFLGSFGLGIYAPGFAVLGLLGLNYVSVLAINMLSAIAVSSANSIDFIRKEKYNKKYSLTITLFGSIGVLCAGFLASSVFLGNNVTIITSVLQVVVALLALVSGIKFYVDSR